jgi:hypothetical protein
MAPTGAWIWELEVTFGVSVPFLCSVLFFHILEVTSGVSVPFLCSVLFFQIPFLFSRDGRFRHLL